MKNLLKPRPFQLESKLHDFSDEEINDDISNHNFNIPE